jgi:hypothetical protein
LCGENDINVNAFRFLISVGDITSKNMQIMLANSFIRVKEEYGDFANTILAVATNTDQWRGRNMKCASDINHERACILYMKYCS